MKPTLIARCFALIRSNASVATTPVVITSQNTVTNNLTNGSHFHRLFK